MTYATIDNAALLLGRALLASVFVASSVSKLAGAPPEIAAIRSLRLPAPAFLERLAGICEIAGALMLVLGLGARLAAMLLALFTIFLSFAFLQFWSPAGPPEAAQGQKTAFFGNMGVIGGLMFVAIAGPGTIALNAAS